MSARQDPKKLRKNRTEISLKLVDPETSFLMAVQEQPLCSCSDSRHGCPGWLFSDERGEPRSESEVVSSWTFVPLVVRDPTQALSYLRPGCTSAVSENKL